MSNAKDLLVGAKLGQGQQSEVFRANWQGQDVAIKLAFKISATGHGVLLDFRRESALLARLNHPCLPEVYEVGLSGDRPYLILELMKGQTLEAQLKGGPLSPGELADIFLPLADLLHLLASQGLVHRDLKPANIFPDENGLPKLIDFGLYNTKRNEVRKDLVIGTLSYTAPEQAGTLAVPVDGRSDLYSMGAIMYECLAGEPPFKATDVADLLRQHAHQTPKPLTEFRQDLPESLCAIVYKLMAKDPDQRFQDGGELARALQPFLSDKRSTFTVAESYDSPLIGRVAEKQKLLQAWQNAQNGIGTSVDVSGPAGSGKSRLIEDIALGARASSGLVLRGKCDLGSPIPFSLFKMAIDNYLLRVSASPEAELASVRQSLSEAAGPWLPALRNFSPLLSRLLPGENHTQDFSKEVYFEALAEFLIQLAKRVNGLCLVLEDLQWIEEASLQVLTRLKRSLGESPLLLLTSSRHDEREKARIEEVHRRLGEPFDLTFALSPLSWMQTQEVIQSILGRRPIPSHLVDRVHQYSQGIPFVILEYVHAMLDGGVLFPGPKSWLVDQNALEKLALSGDVVQIILSRVDSLDKQTLEILSVAALFGRAFSKEMITPMLATSAGLDSALSQAQSKRLIEKDEAGQYVFVHDRIQEAFMSRLASEKLPGLHFRAGQVLYELRGLNDSFLFAAARHFRDADPTTDLDFVFAALFEAGQMALGKFAFVEALDALALAHSIAKREGFRLNRVFHEAMADALFENKQVLQSMEWYKSALEFPNSGIGRAKIRIRLTRALLADLILNDAADVLRQAFLDIDEVPLSDHWTSFLRALWQSVVALAIFILPPRLRRFVTMNKEKAAVLIRLFELRGFIDFFNLDYFKLTQGTIRNFRPALAVGGAKERIYHSANFSIFLMMCGLHGWSKNVMARAVKLADQHRDPVLIGHVTFYKALGLYLQGLHAEAEKFGKLALERYGNWLTLENFINAAGTVMAAQQSMGHSQQGIEFIEHCLEWLKQRMSGAETDAMGSHFAAWNYMIGAALHAQSGDIKKAAEHRSQLAKITLTAPYDIGLAFPNELQFLIETGDWGQAADQTIARFHEKKYSPQFLPSFINRMYYLIGYLELYRLRQEKPVTEASLTRFRRALRQLHNISPVLPLSFRYHYKILSAADLALKRKWHRSEKWLSKAENFALANDDRSMLFEIYVQRAHNFRERGLLVSAERQAFLAYDFALRIGWLERARRLQSEFPSLAHQSGTRGRYLGSTLSVRAKPDIYIDRKLHALTELSLRSSRTPDLEEQQRTVLDVMVQLFNAERAYLFLLDAKGQSVTFKCGRSTGNQDIPENENFSRTVVRRCFETAAPLIVSGSDKGLVLGSDSIVAQNLRSIMATPLMLQEKVIGVVYLDSRVARGIFTEADTDVLNALSVHIAISLDKARMAELELQQQSLEKDLEVAGAVQKFILPRILSHSESHFDMAAFYQSSAQAGGDWWWWQKTMDRKVRVVIGDVTGHGAGSAMVTAAVSGSYQAMDHFAPSLKIQDILPILNHTLIQVSGDEFAMSMAAIEWDPDERSLSWLTAGAPPIFVMHEDGRTEILLVANSQLGRKDFTSKIQNMKIPGPARLFLFTDGLYECHNTKGRELGLKRLSDLFIKTKPLGVEQSRDFLCRQVQQYVEDQPFLDDVNFVIIDLK